MKSNGIASDNLLLQAAASPQDEFVAGHGRQSASIPPQALLERVLDRANLQRALKQVRQNKGAPGIAGMSIDELPRHLKEHWLKIRAQLVAGTYCPQPVKRVEIPKPDGKKRPLGCHPSRDDVNLFIEPPCTVPYARWCGRGKIARSSPIPIGCRQ